MLPSPDRLPSFEVQAIETTKNSKKADLSPGLASGMFPIVNGTPLQADAAILRDRDGAEVLVVAVKGTFHLGRDERALLAIEQEQIRLIPQYRGDAGAASLILEAEMTDPKPETDIVLDAIAHAPNNEPAQVVPVGIKIGRVAKRVVVFGERLWLKGAREPRISQPIPFVTMPIIYERAFGGRDRRADGTEVWDERNPVGTGYICEPGEAPGRRLPNIERPDDLIASWKDRPAPAGFGPLERHWLPRRGLAGTYDDAYLKERVPLPPTDLDERFYLGAPPDQQSGAHLVGGEQVELHNLSPAGLQRFRIPQVRPGVSALIAGKLSFHTVNLDTLFIRPHARELALVWRAVIPCHRRSLRIERVSIWLKTWIHKAGGVASS